MVRYILWFLILWFVIKALQSFLSSRQNRKKAQRAPDKKSTPPFENVEEADFEDITPKG